MPLAKIPLSGSTHGRPQKVVNTVVGSADTIHTAQATTTDGKGDDVTLYGFNSDTVSRDISICFGGVTVPDDIMKFTIPAGEYDLLIPGLLLRNGLVIKAFASAANVITLSGYVIRSS